VEVRKSAYWGTTQQTHEWGTYKCRIDIVLTKAAGARLGVIKERWGCLSVHTALGARLETEENVKRVVTQTDWRKVREYIDREVDLEKAGLYRGDHDFNTLGGAYRALKSLLSNEWTRELNV